MLSQVAYPELKRAGHGKIINIGSMMSLFGAPFAAAYAASKGGLVQLTKALATAWAAENIQVNALHMPAGRWGVPEDLTGIAVFVASDASGFITGAAIPVDGGYSAQG